MHLIVCVLVQPVECSPMLGSERRQNPDHGVRTNPCRIGQTLTEMRVVGTLQLVLDRHESAVIKFRKQVE
jgi:hypothetical protein